MEKVQAKKQYEYKANSNLVLIADRTGTPRETGPTSEVTSLSKMTLKQLTSQFGDRVRHDRAPIPGELSELEERKKKSAARREREFEEPKRKKKTLTGSVLGAEIDNVYRPQTRETRIAYEVLLSFIQQELGDKPHDVIRSAADEVLHILKDDTLKDREKQRDIEGLFRRNQPMDIDRFSKLVNLGSKITDFKADGDDETKEGGEDEEPALDEDMGVPVVFDKEEEEEEEDDDIDEVRDEIDEDEDEGAEATSSFAITAKALEQDADAEEGAHRDDIDVRTIDAHWIQREMSSFYKDALTSQKMSDDVFRLLSSDEPDGKIENQLVLLLDYDKFPFIKKLMRNRLKLVYALKLARASNDSEKDEIKKEMESNPKLRPILDALSKTTTASERHVELQKKLIAEAGALKGGRKGMAVDDEKLGDRTTEVFWAKKPKTLLDLDALSFEAGAHLMSEKEVKLPKKSEVVNKKGYQEVHIPALRAPEMGSDKLVAIGDLPSWARKAFAGMKTLNRVQSKVYDTVFKTPENILLCAPTGAGKTNVAMLAMMREIGLNRREDGTIDLDNFKIIYVAPMKSLVQEMVQNFSRRLEPYGISVKELSGDAQLTKAQINATQVIVTTPEKWDIITRKSGDRTYTQLVKLVIIDEIHLLHDTRGPVLESIVSRTIRQIESTQELIRLVGLSATLPNYEDVAMFLRVKSDKGLFYFDGSYRPVPLHQQYIGLTQKRAFRRDTLMNEILYEKVMAQAGKNQVLIFCHSRKETANTARALRDMAQEKDELSKFVRDESGRRELLETEAKETAKNEALKELLPYGFAIHHAGLARSDRELVEELFADQHIQVLVSTATLAWGVNLPAHTVIIKGTQIYNPEKGRWVELSPLDVMQMMGRAGRPQYDTEGEGIIITSHKELSFYLSLLNQQLPVESQFMSRLADNLNAEIVLGTVQNVREAVTWLGYTYLYVRMCRRPGLYGISIDEIEADPLLDQRRIDLIHSAATVLDKHNLIKYDRKTGNFQVTDLGRVASHYYLSHQSMAVFNEYLKPTMSDIEILRVFSLSSEFKYMTVREEEKGELARLLDKVPIPIKESIEESSAKVNVLLQSFISRLTLEGFALMADMVYVTQSAGRLMRALYEIVLRRGWASVAAKCLNLCKMINHRMWAAQSPLRQFKGIPADIIKRIEAKDFAWDRFYDLEPHAIGELIRFPRMGKTVHRAVHQLPRLDLQGHVQPITRSILRVELTITPDFQWEEKVHGDAEPFWIWVEDVDGETILHHEYFILKKKYAQQEATVTFTIPIHDPLPPQYFIRVVSDRWLGSEVVLPVSFRHLILPEKYPAATELLDLQPIPVTELANEKYITFYDGQFDYFNPIQTQVFNTVYKRDDHVLVAAPTGSGKTVIAELAIMRMLTKEGRPSCVYIAPLEAIANERLADWSIKFGKNLGVKVAKLTGDTTADLRLLHECPIVISTPAIWDQLSRRWRTRAAVQEVRLYIVDELHLIGGDQGPTLEIITSRMRYISSELKNNLRIVALSTSVANAKDLGDWIGASGHNCFAFAPLVRPVPLEIRVQGFDQHEFSSRQLAMVKPTYLAITQHSPDKPVIVFVPSRAFARSVAVDIVTFATADGDSRRFLHADAEDMAAQLKYIGNKTLQETLERGVAFYHEGLTDREKQTVERLFKAGAVQVLVSEYNLAWGMTMASHLVIIMGAQYYDGREHRHVDCPITDVVQMMGRACRPRQDTSGKCVIFCHSPKKEFYKKFLYDPFPVESHLDHALADHLNAEIVTRRIEDPQEAVDYMTWTFFYRRLTQNPNYYNLAGVSHRHVSDHLSELVENTIEDLVQAKCVSLEDDQLSALNLGMIAAFYYIKCTTVELFANSLTKGTKLKGLLEVLSSASEFEEIPVRHREDIALRKLASHLPLAITDANFTDAHTKTNVLLQAHFSRIPLAAAVQSDLDRIVPEATRLLQAIVDVISSNSWLSPALAAMELSQMVTQGLWKTDSPLLQLPHVTPELAKTMSEAGVESVPDLMDLDDAVRNKLLADMPPAKLADIARFCNNFPDIEVNYKMTAEDDDEEAKLTSIDAGEKVVLTVDLEKEEDDDAESKGGIPVVQAPRYPSVKLEGWWLVVGRADRNEMLAIKRVQMRKSQMQIKLDFAAPEEAGEHKLMLYLMCDSYLGCDQEFPITLRVNAATAVAKKQSDDEASDDEDMQSKE